MASSHTLPDVLMLDNPDLQQFAQSGALTALGNYGISAKGYQKGVVAASTYKGKLYGLQPITNSIALFYNKDLLAKAGVTPPKTWADLRADAKKLTSGNTYASRSRRRRRMKARGSSCRSLWSNGGDERNIATPQVAAALQLLVDLKSDGSMSASVVNWSQGDVNDQFKAGNAAMMVNGHGSSRCSTASPASTTGSCRFPCRRREAFRLLARRRDVDRPEHRQVGKRVARGEGRAVPQLGQEPAAAREEASGGPDQAGAAAAVRSGKSGAEGVQHGRQDRRARTGELGANWPKAATKIYTAEQCALTGQGTPEKCLAQAQNG